MDAGTVLLRVGERGHNAILILRSFIKIAVPTVSGRETLLSIRLPGDMIGEASVLNDQPRTATATACGPGLVSVIGRSPLRDFLSTRPAVTMQLAGIVADRLRWANDRRVDAATYPVASRLARILSEMAMAYGVRSREGIEIGVELTQTEMSTLIGVSDVTLQRALRRLRDAGLVSTGYRRTIVTDTEGLRTFGERLDAE